MERIVEVRKEGDEWAVYAEGRLLQGGLPSEEFALKVAAAVREVIEPYAPEKDYHHQPAQDEKDHPS